MTRASLTSTKATRESGSSDRARDLLREAVAWAVLGYAVLFVLLSICGVMLLGGVLLSLHYQGVLGTLASGLLAFAGLLGATLILICLWVKFDPPQGLVLEEREHPELHRLIRETAARTGGADFQQVVLDAEMNAAAVQNPRFGLLGWYRSYLVIGLPLMEILSTQEFQAVLAHELAHLGGRDGKIRAWLYRTRTTWEKIAGRLGSSPLCPLLAKFSHWFWLRFNARAFLLSRLNELEADRVAAATVSAEALASGLRRLAIQEQRLEDEFRTTLESGSGDLPADMMERQSALIRTEPEAERREQWSARSMAQGADATDTHPGLVERLAQLGSHGGTSAPLVPPASAAGDLLDPTFAARARESFSKKWLENAQRTRAARRKIASGETSGGSGVRDAWKRIAALSRLDGLNKVQPELVALLEKRPDHPGALYLRGCHLAETGDPSSIACLEKAATDPTLAGPVYETLARFHSRFGDPAEMSVLKERAEQHDRNLRAALVERNRVTRQDSFLSHELGEQDLERLREALAAEPAIRRAWLGAKEVRHFPCWKHLVLMVDARWPAFTPVSERMQQQLIDRLSRCWEGDGYILPIRLDEGTKPILRVLRRGVADSEVYRRP